MSQQQLGSCFWTLVYPLYRCLQSPYRSVRMAERPSDYLTVMMSIRVVMCWFVLSVCKLLSVPVFCTVWLEKRTTQLWHACVKHAFALHCPPLTCVVGEFADVRNSTLRENCCRRSNLTHVPRTRCFTKQTLDLIVIVIIYFVHKTYMVMNDGWNTTDTKQDRKARERQ